MGLHGRDQRLGGDSQKRWIEAAPQSRWPFHKARDFIQQVFRQRHGLARARQSKDLFCDQRASLVLIDQHACLA